MCEKTRVGRLGGNPGSSTAIESSAPNVVYFNWVRTRSWAAKCIGTQMTEPIYRPGMDLREKKVDHISSPRRKT